MAFMGRSKRMPGALPSAQQIFTTWELEVCGKLRPEAPLQKIVREIGERWQRLLNEAAYAQSIVDVRDAQNRVARRQIRLSQAQRTAASFSTPRGELGYSAAVEVLAQSKVERDLRALLHGRRALMAALQDLQAEQEFANTQNEMNGDAVSRRYTTELFKHHRQKVLDEQIAIDACRALQRQLGRESSLESLSVRLTGDLSVHKRQLAAGLKTAKSVSPQSHANDKREEAAAGSKRTPSDALENNPKRPRPGPPDGVFVPPNTLPENLTGPLPPTFSPPQKTQRLTRSVLETPGIPRPSTENIPRDPLETYTANEGPAELQDDERRQGSGRRTSGEDQRQRDPAERGPREVPVANGQRRIDGGVAAGAPGADPNGSGSSKDEDGRPERNDKGIGRKGVSRKADDGSDEQREKDEVRGDVLKSKAAQDATEPQFSPAQSARTLNDHKIIDRLILNASLAEWVAVAEKSQVGEPKVDIAEIFALLDVILADYADDHDWNTEPSARQLLRRRMMPPYGEPARSSGGELQWQQSSPPPSAQMRNMQQLAMSGQGETAADDNGELPPQYPIVGLPMGPRLDPPTAMPAPAVPFTPLLPQLPADGPAQIRIPQPPIPPNGLPPPGAQAAAEAPPIQQIVAIPLDAQKGRAAAQLGFDSPFQADAGQWNFKTTLGIGGYGHAGLWVQYDGNEKIINRMVLKETYLRSTEWNNPSFWQDLPARRPREAFIHGILSSLPQSRNIIQVYSGRVYRERRMHRLYMEFAPHGNLHDIIDAHYNAGGNVTQDGTPIDTWVPVAAVWAVFEALTTAACLMRNGALPGSAPGGGWRGDLGEIIHRDLRPVNIFFGPINSSKWQGIPTAKLGDFGLATHNNVPGFDNPQGLIDVGPLNYMAPECFGYNDPGFRNLCSISSAANVYSIGKTILSLMSNTVDWEVSATFYDSFGEGFVTIPEYVLDHYPEDLTSLLDRCMQATPHRRIEVDALLGEITRIVQAYPQDFSGVPIKFAGLDDQDILRVKQDRYALKFAK